CVGNGDGEDAAEFLEIYAQRDDDCGVVFTADGDELGVDFQPLAVKAYFRDRLESAGKLVGREVENALGQPPFYGSEAALPLGGVRALASSEKHLDKAVNRL